jgi:starvation-inducible outer membrane lipoprotein
MTEDLPKTPLSTNQEPSSDLGPLTPEEQIKKYNLDPNGMVAETARLGGQVVQVTKIPEKKKH